MEQLVDHLQPLSFAGLLRSGTFSVSDAPPTGLYITENYLSSHCDEVYWLIELNEDQLLSLKLRCLMLSSVKIKD